MLKLSAPGIASTTDARDAYRAAVGDHSVCTHTSGNVTIANAGVAGGEPTFDNYACGTHNITCAATPDGVYEALIYKSLNNSYFCGTSQPFVEEMFTFLVPQPSSPCDEATFCMRLTPETALMENINSASYQLSAAGLANITIARDFLPGCCNRYSAWVQVYKYFREDRCAESGDSDGKFRLRNREHHVRTDPAAGRKCLDL